MATVEARGARCMAKPHPKNVELSLVAPRAQREWAGTGENVSASVFSIDEQSGSRRFAMPTVLLPKSEVSAASTRDARIISVCASTNIYIGNYFETLLLSGALCNLGQELLILFMGLRRAEVRIVSERAEMVNEKKVSVHMQFPTNQHEQ